MKKLTLLVALVMLLQMAFAGGLLTNYNHSAQYIRMLSRNASIDIDGVFYNPAGLIKMEDGWHFAFYSQSVFQTREVTTAYPLELTSTYYEGETFIPIYPDVYAVYKKNKWAFSLGIGPVAGGGTSEFSQGIPSLEIGYASAVYGLSGLGVTGYDLDMAFDAASTFWGIQLGATYAIDDKFSVYGGARLMPSSTVYQGYIKNVQLEANGETYNASDFLTSYAGTVSDLADGAFNAADNMQLIVAAGGSSYSLAQLEYAGFISSTDRAQLEGGLLALGVSQTYIDNMTASQIQETYTAAGSELETTAQTLEVASEGMEDREVDAKQKGFGITPIIGFNYSPNNDWNFAMKYEFKTKLTLENETKVDDIGLFPDGEKKVNDVPAIFAAGVGYRGLDWLEVQLSYNMYFDKDVDYGYNIRYSTNGELVHRDIDNNYWELSLGLQFNLSEKLAISVGGHRAKTGVSPEFQSDFSYSNSSHTIGGGIMWKITDKLTFDFGCSNSFYEDDTVEFADSNVGNYNETYGKKTFMLATGLSYSIF